jgi:Rrf2 family protein
MNITSKSRYALKIMMDLAATSDGSLTHRADIAGRQGIPLDYMDQILGRLRDARLIASTRGRAGGYRLARPATEVSALAIFTAVEDAFEPVSCLESGTGGCMVESICGAKDAWSEISHAIHKSLSGILLSELVARDQASLQARMPGLVAPPLQECRAPSRRAGGVAK